MAGPVNAVTRSTGSSGPGVDGASSDVGSAGQTGNTFNITELGENTKDTYSNKIAKMTFSYKLYDEDGNVKTLTGGKMKSRFMHY